MQDAAVGGPVGNVCGLQGPERRELLGPMSERQTRLKRVRVRWLGPVVPKKRNLVKRLNRNMHKTGALVARDLAARKSYRDWPRARRCGVAGLGAPRRSSLRAR